MRKTVRWDNLTRPEIEQLIKEDVIVIIPTRQGAGALEYPYRPPVAGDRPPKGKKPWRLPDSHKYHYGDIYEQIIGYA